MWGRGEKDETDESKRRKGSGTLNKAEALQEGRRQLKMLEKKDCAFYLLATDASKKGKKKNQNQPTGDGQKIVLVEERGVLPNLSPLDCHPSPLMDTTPVSSSHPKMFLPPVARVRGLGVFNPTHSTSCSLPPA